MAAVAPGGSLTCLADVATTRSGRSSLPAAGNSPALAWRSLEGRTGPPRPPPPVLARLPVGRAAEGAGSAGTGAEPGFDGGPVWMRLIPSAVMLSVDLSGITAHS